MALQHLKHKIKDYYHVNNCTPKNDFQCINFFPWLDVIILHGAMNRLLYLACTHGGFNGLTMSKCSFLGIIPLNLLHLNNG